MQCNVAKMRTHARFESGGLIEINIPMQNSSSHCTECIQKPIALTPKWPNIDCVPISRMRCHKYTHDVVPLCRNGSAFDSHLSRVAFSFWKWALCVGRHASCKLACILCSLPFLSIFVAKHKPFILHYFVYLFGTVFGAVFQCNTSAI